MCRQTIQVFMCGHTKLYVRRCPGAPPLTGEMCHNSHEQCTSYMQKNCSQRTCQVGLYGPHWECCQCRLYSRDQEGTWWLAFCTTPLDATKTCGHGLCNDCSPLDPSNPPRPKPSKDNPPYPWGTWTPWGDKPRREEAPSDDASGEPEPGSSSGGSKGKGKDKSKDTGKDKGKGKGKR